MLLVGGNAIGIKFKSNLGYNVGVTKHLRGKYLAGFIFLKQIHKYREVVFYSDPRAKRRDLGRLHRLRLSRDCPWEVADAENVLNT